MNLVVSYLFGSRDAIEAIAGSRAALSAGFLLTISAGIARNYDAVYLPHHLYLLLLPALASIVTSLLTFIAVQWLYCRHGGELPGFWRGYGQFLGLFWMTAPLAWLYAIPVERWMDATGAMIVNLWLLALVASWRVLLMIRVVRVVYGLSRIASIASVGVVSAIVTVFALFAEQASVLRMMGGIRMSAEEELLLKITQMGMSIAAVVFLGCAVLYAIAVLRHRATPFPVPQSNSRANGKRFLIFAIVAVLLPVPLIFGAQREQKHATELAAAYQNNGWDGLVTTMRAYGRDAYPPQFNPIRDTVSWIKKPLEMFTAFEENDAPDWLRFAAYDKFERTRFGFALTEAELRDPRCLPMLQDMQRFVTFGQRFQFLACQSVSAAERRATAEEAERLAQIKMFMQCDSFDS